MGRSTSWGDFMHRRAGITMVAALAALMALPLSAAAASNLVSTRGNGLQLRNNSISGNWAGYVDVPATGHKITSVTGRWTVPIAGQQPPGVSSTWTGIGGFSTQDLIQAGTQQVSSPVSDFITGGPYAAWIELLPAAPVFISGCSGDLSCTVRPGDLMTVTIASPGGSQWSVSMDDFGHWSYTTTETYTSTESSAEWIHEAPSLAGVLPIPVGNSGTVTFDGDNTFGLDGSSSQLDIAAPQGSPTATDALPVETTTSALDSDGEGFNVCTYALSCAPPAS